MPKHLLPIPHQLQRNDGDCLAACVAMVLESLKQPVDYGRRLQLLKIKSYGAPASNVRLLAQLNLAVTYGITNIAGLENMLAQAELQMNPAQGQRFSRLLARHREGKLSDDEQRERFALFHLYQRLWLRQLQALAEAAQRGLCAPF